ncbi:MAG: hypothetical protein JST94_01890 [Bacteroidetes bacterium]|nr:hypothetical protein [Bacteroidota bacterium]MBS1670200.1 hypothetical protein [Bacteroidota bacterium]
MLFRKIYKLIIVVWIVSCISCTQKNYILQTPQPNVNAINGNQFYKTVAAWKWKERDSLAVKEILSGNIPSFLKKFVRINVQCFDSVNKKIIHAYYFVAPDYLSIGSNANWARVPLTPMAAQKIADTLHCFLPTRKMVNDIYNQSVIKLEPVPMYAFRDSSVTMWQHHLIIEGQRQLKKGLIAGIKKDVVISGLISRYPKPNHEAIYGWHKLDGKPIQPLYVGHINWWVDYSHGIRLVYEKIWVEGKPMLYADVLSNTTLKNLLCDEGYCDFYKYNY